MRMCVQSNVKTII